MKKLISILLVLTLLFAFASCGNVAEEKPDYSKIRIYVNNTVLTPENSEELLSHLNTAFHFTDGSPITVVMEYVLSELDGISYTDHGDMSVSFDMEERTLEELAREIEKLSAVPNVSSIKTEAHVNIGEIDYSKIIIPVTTSYAQDIPADREELIALLNTHVEVFADYYGGERICMHIRGHIEEERFSDMLDYSSYRHMDDVGRLYTDFSIDTEKLDVERFANALEQLTRYSDIERIELKQYLIADND